MSRYGVGMRRLAFVIRWTADRDPSPPEVKTAMMLSRRDYVTCRAEGRRDEIRFAARGAAGMGVQLSSRQNDKNDTEVTMNNEGRVLWIVRSFSLLLFALLAGCGGGGSGSAGSASNPLPPALAPPSGLKYASAPGLRLGTPMDSMAPTVTGTVSAYSVAPSLPSGLSLDAATGVISGTPSQLAALTTYAITATNPGGSTTFNLSLKVFTIEVTTASISRIAADQASIYLDVGLQATNLDVSSLYVSADDPSGFILPSVEVAAMGNGSFMLALVTNPSVSPNVFAGNVKLNLCKDNGCTTPLEVSNVIVPFSVTVLSSISAWPGDHQTPLARWEGVSDWSTIQGNSAHTGFVPVTVDPDKFTTRWKTIGNTVTEVWAPKANLSTENGLIYVVSASSFMLYAKRESDASEAWHYSFAGMIYFEPNPAAVKNGVVYVPAGHQTETYMFAFDAANGSLVYRTPMSSQWDFYSAPTVGPNGMLYANAGMFGGLYAFNPSGNQLFFTPEAEQSNWTPAVDATGVYAWTGVLRVHDLLTGQVLHQIVDPTYQNFVYEIGGAPVIGAPGSIFAAGYANAGLNAGGIGNTLTNFRTNTDSIGWQVRGVYPTTPGYKDQVIYPTNNNPFRLEARAESDGELLWSWTPPAAGDSRFISETLLTQNLAFVSTDRATYAIDLKTHHAVFSYPAHGKLALSANGVLYIQNTNDLIAINLK
jgi:hypothetical protein